LLVGWSASVVAWDLRYRRIPNWLLLAAAIPALALLLLKGHGPIGAGWLASLAGAAIAAAVWLPGYLLRRLGAGDVKLAACIGGLLGGVAAVEAMLLAAATLGALAVVAGLAFGAAYRLPAAVALCGGMLMRLVLGPLVTG
jgi:prepilin peptidase CpaA